VVTVGAKDFGKTIARCMGKISEVLIACCLIFVLILLQ
jgi:hypothetical protein